MRNSCVTIDITNSDIRIVALENGKITKWKSEPIPEGLIKGGTILEQQSMSVLIENLFKSLNLGKNRVICCITGLPFIYRTINMPGIGREVSSESLERAARKEMSLSEEDMYLSWQPVAENQDKKETDFFVVGVPKTSLNPLLNTLSLAKITPLSIDIKPLALARAAASENALVVSLEKNYFDIALVANGMLRVIHSVSPSVDSDDVKAIVGELVDGLNKAVKSFYREFPQTSLAPETPIFLSGEFALENEMLNLIQEATGHPTGIIKSPIEVPPEMPVRIFAANIGLSLKNMPEILLNTQYKDINLNLFLSTHKQTKSKFKVVYAVAALVFVVLAAGVYYVFDMKSRAEASVAIEQQKSEALTKKITDAQKANKDVLTAKQTSLANLQAINDQITVAKDTSSQISGQKRDYAFRITYILSRLPTGAEYTKLSMQPQSIQVLGRVKYPIDTVTTQIKNPSGAVQFAESVAQNDIFTNARVVAITPVQGDDTTAEFVVLISE
jgi:Tfp pilus assembly PilM family ATPase/Tfp pilus assembly protein PilN